MAIINKFLTQNPYCNDGKWISGSNFRGFFLHSVGCAQPNPMVFINNWNKSNFTYAGINGFIDDENIYITASCLDYADKVKRMPHAGKTVGNNCYIGFEMCEPSQLKYGGGASFTCSNIEAARNYCRKTYGNAVTLFAKLCTFHGKNPLTPGVIYSHNEGGKLGIAAGHVDPEHLWKGLGLPFTMNGFRQDVYNKMHKNNNNNNNQEEDYMTRTQILKELDDTYIRTYSELPSWAKSEMRELLDSGVVNGGTSYENNKDDINMYLSDIKSILVCKRMLERK